MKNGKTTFYVALYAQVLFWVFLFGFLLFAASEESLLPGLRVAVMVAGCLSLAGIALLFRLARDSFANRLPAPELERARLQAELELLQSQTSPLLLANTIEDVYALSLVRPDRTPTALLKLSGLLHYLHHESKQRVPLHKELQALESYISLLQLRYEDPLDITIDTQVRSADTPIEPLLLIPLLESAFRDSGVGMTPDAFIRLQVREEPGRNRRQIRAHIIHSRPALPVNGHAVSPGLQHIRKRLGMLLPYRPEENLVVLESGPVCEIFVRIPGS